VKVTIDDIQAGVARVQYLRVPDSTTTVCALHMKSGYVVIGHSACVDPAEFNEDLGRKIALQHALDQCWPLFGFLLAATGRSDVGVET
jgi:hypothetical protein